MPRPITLTSGQWADMDFDKFASIIQEIGYDGLELATRGGVHFDVDRALAESDYCDQKREQLAKYGLRCWAMSGHAAGQCVLDRIDERHRKFVSEKAWGNGDGDGVNQRAAEELKRLAKAAQKFGVSIITGFTGSSLWPYLYSFPPVPQGWIDDGFKLLAERFHPILDVFGECGVKFALEVHPTEIAFDLYSAERALDALGHRPEFGFNFDPSHLLWQGIDPVKFLYHFQDRIYHVHMKDVAMQLDGKSGVLSSHLNFGDARRGWDFRSLGHGDVKFGEIIRALNHINYQGPLSVEWEDSGMERVYGAKDAFEYVKKINFAPNTVAFDAAFDSTNR
ncbi:MAG: sugar phosphate isomerase/epimerase [Planctomycetaceae bacterium]|nr:sugar phosphate isomerase/epimerase [Planctomycetaceae bacterium]